MCVTVKSPSHTANDYLATCVIQTFRRSTTTSDFEPENAMKNKSATLVRHSPLDQFAIVIRPSTSDPAINCKRQAIN
ncbi:hypothetical protein MAR_023489, partial [Mya arenaria]